MEKLFVIIVTYNGEKWIYKCLNSVVQSNYPSTIILIDNNSTDKTLDIIKKEFPVVHIIESKKNLGFGKANNIGIAKAINEGADYIYLLNQDAWVTPNTFEQLIKIHKSNPAYGILSPIQLTGSGNNIDKNFLNIILTDTYNKYPQILSDLLLNKTNDVYETKFVMAAHWLLYVPNIIKVGLFSPAFPHYGEDANLAQRYLYNNLKIGICPNTFAYHDRQCRKTSSEKQLYLNYIYILTRFHDIYNNNTQKKSKALLVYLKRLLLARKVPIKVKLNNLYSTIKDLGKAKKYREYYKHEDCYKKFLN